MNKQIDKLVWHDGNLSKIALACPKAQKDRSSILLQAELYEDETPEAKRKKQISLLFENILRFTSTINILELANNAVNGNISDAYFNYKEKIFFMNLFEGYIEIQFKKIKLLIK